MMNTLNEQNDEKKSEIDYLFSSINKLKKEKSMKKHLYVMQTTYSFDWLIDILFAADYIHNYCM